jgi:hypothetical protein
MAKKKVGVKKRKRIVWRDGRVFSMPLRNGKYALLQMSDRIQLVIFKFFRNEDIWDDLELCSDDILFSCYFLTSDLKRNNVTFHKKLNPVAEVPSLEVKLNSMGNRRLTLWEGTEHERSIIVLNDGNNGLHRSGRDAKGNIIDEFTPIKNEDYEKYKHLEIAGLRG